MSIKIDGVDIENIGFKVTSFTELELGGKTRDYQLEIPNRNGEVDLGATLAPKLFNFQCVFVGNESSADIFAAMELLISALFDEDGFPMEILLEFNSNPGRFYTVRYKGSLPFLKRGLVGDFTLPLVCFEVFARGVTQTVNTTAGVTEAVVKTTKYRLSPKVTVTATSSVTDVTLQIDAISDLALGVQNLNYTGTLSLNDVLVFDVEKFQTYLNGVLVNSDVDGTFPKMGTGTNNVTVSLGSGTADVKIEWKEKYLW